MSWKEDLRKQIARDERAKARAVIARLRAELAAAKRARRARVAELRMGCRKARQELRERHAAERAAATEQRKRERAALAADCRVTAQATGETVAAARKRLIEERGLQWLLRPRKPARSKSTARERRSESDDAAESNLPPDLRPAWRRLKQNFPGGPRISRAEQFLHWAEENPEALYETLSDAADDDVERMIAEYEGAA